MLSIPKLLDYSSTNRTNVWGGEGGEANLDQIGTYSESSTTIKIIYKKVTHA